MNDEPNLFPNTRRFFDEQQPAKDRMSRDMDAMPEFLERFSQRLEEIEREHHRNPVKRPWWKRLFA